MTNRDLFSSVFHYNCDVDQDRLPQFYNFDDCVDTRTQFSEAECDSPILQRTHPCPIPQPIQYFSSNNRHGLDKNVYQRPPCSCRKF